MGANKTEWSTGDDEMLRKLWPDPTVSIQRLSVQLDRDPRAIRRRVKTLGLRQERVADRPSSQSFIEANLPQIDYVPQRSPCCGAQAIPDGKDYHCLDCGAKIKSGLGLSPSEAEIRAARLKVKSHALRAMQDAV